MWSHMSFIFLLASLSCIIQVRADWLVMESYMYGCGVGTSEDVGVVYMDKCLYSDEYYSYITPGSDANHVLYYICYDAACSMDFF